MDHPNQEMNRILVCRVGSGLPFGKWRNYRSLMPPTLIPCTRVGDFAVLLMPQLGFGAGADQWVDGAGHDGNVGAANDFEQAQGVSHFFIAPLISAGYRYA